MAMAAAQIQDYKQSNLTINMSLKVLNWPVWHVIGQSWSWCIMFQLMLREFKLCCRANQVFICWSNRHWGGWGWAPLTTAWLHCSFKPYVSSTGSKHWPNIGREIQNLLRTFKVSKKAFWEKLIMISMLLTLNRHCHPGGWIFDSTWLLLWGWHFSFRGRQSASGNAMTKYYCK